MNRKRMWVLGVVLFLVTTAGCGLIQVDKEKDMERVVIEIGDNKIIKREFNKYLTYQQLLYESNKYAMPEGDSLKTMKEDLLNTIVEISILRKEAEKLDLVVALDDLQEEVNGLLKNFEDSLGETKYLRVLSDNQMTKEEFASFFYQYMEDVRYANATITNFSENLRGDASEELAKAVMVIDGETIKKEELYYQLSMLEFQYYLGTGSGLPKDEESLAFVYEDIQNRMEETRLMSALASDAGLSVSAEEIEKTANSMKTSFTTYFNDETLGTYLGDYYLTTEKYDALLAEDAKRTTLIEKYKKSLETGITVTTGEIKEYYDKHKDSYDVDTVSAKHILTESEEYATKLLANITDGATFEAALSLAENDENVKEATDLGSFTFGQMATEFSAAAFALKPGEISGKPVKTEFGYHIIYVYDKHTAVIPSLEEKTEEIRSDLVKTKAMEIYTEKATAAKKAADIKREEIKDPFEIYLDHLREQDQIKTYPSRL